MEAKRKIKVVGYDPAWPVRYEQEAETLRSVFGNTSLSIDHIGSTAVPGLSAKPTIDILVVVEAGTDIPNFDARMEDEGYICRGEALGATIPGTPGRFYYVRRRGADHLTHVHVCAEGHYQVVELLAFRDFLRTHPERAAMYGLEKSELSSQFTDDNIGYMKGKDACVKELIREALEWRAEQK